MNFLSICSGIEAASVAWGPLGWKPVGFSEIEAFPSAVLAYHYPSVPNYGDMTNYKDWDIHEPIDIICGGTPCFPVDTPIVTTRGLIPIEEVEVGDDCPDGPRYKALGNSWAVPVARWIGERIKYVKGM